MTSTALSLLRGQRVNPAEWYVTRLDNGLRVVVSPARGSGAVAVAVAYGVGIRDERPGQAGFAHLFEHLMNQGSAHLERFEHKQLIEDSGGSYGANTRHDCTIYQSTWPGADVELALWCEADRMRGLRITEQSLANEIAVVEQEIRGTVLSRPYGGFPWLPVDATLFSSWANCHDGYGAFADLERSTLDDAAAFFDTYYGPGNAAVCVAGDIEPERAVTLIERYFGDIAPGPPPPGRVDDEPELTHERRVHLDAPGTPLPALALGWRLPDPAGQTEDYLRFKVLNHVLSDGPRSWWQRYLIEERPLARGVEGWVGSLGMWYATRDPAQYAVGVQAMPGVTTDELLLELDRATAALVDGLDGAATRRGVVAALTSYQRGLATSRGRAVFGAVCELLYGSPTLGDPVSVWTSTTAAHLRELARRWLLTPGRAVVDISGAAA